MRLADLGAVIAEILDGDILLAALAAARQVLRRRLAETRDRHKGRAQRAVLDKELRRVGMVQVDGQEGKAAHVELVHRLERDEQIVLVGGAVGLALEVVDLAAHRVGSAAHHRRVKAALLAAPVEIGRVERQRLVHLEPGDAEGHHDIGHGVRLGEEIGDLARRFDPPVRHAHVAHLLLGVAGEIAALLDLALTHGLHRLEGQRGLHPLLDQIDHDVVAAADGLVDIGHAVYDQIMDVARPHVGAVGKAGEPHQRIKGAGLGIDEHLAGEGRSELRHADRAGLADDRVVVGKPQHLRRGEDRHGLRVGERDLLGVDAGHILHHADHRRVIVPQLVELQEVGLHAVVFKVRRDDVAVGVVSRVLDGAEVRHVHILRDDDEAAGVLAGRAFDADETERQPVFLGLGGLDAALLEIFFDIAEGRLFRERADRAGAEHMVRAEEHLGVFVRLRLVFAREVQVDIGRFFISRETEEGLEWDVEAVAAHARAAFRAVLFRHVGAAAEAAVFDEFAVAALGADIVRREGVDLRDAGHVGHDRRADAAPAADEVAVLEGVLHELLGAHVNDVVVVREDGVELGVHALLHDGGRGLAVDAVHLVIDKLLELLGRVLDLRGKEVLGQQLDRLDHVGDGAGIRDDDLARGLLAEVGEFRQHLVGRAEIDRAVAVGVRELLGRLEDFSILLVLGVEEVDVARRDDHFAELLAQVQDRAVIVLQHGLVLDHAVFHQKAVVADRLDLQIVVKRRDLFQLLVACALHDGAVQLAHAAGRADEDALAVLDQQALRDRGDAVEILQIALRDHLVEVLQTLAVQNQQDHVIGLGHIRAPQRVIDRLDVVHSLRPLGGEHGQEFAHDARDDHRVVRGAVMVELRQVQVVRHDVELEALQLRAQRLGERERVKEHRRKADVVPSGRRAHEADVEVGVVRDDRPIADEVHEHPKRLVLERRALHVARADAGELRDVGGDGHLRVDKGVELTDDLAAGEDHRADLGHTVVRGVETGGLDIKGDKFRVERQLALADDGAVAVHVVEEIALDAVDDLDVVLLSGLPHIREGLRHTVVRHGDGGHAPVFGARDDRLRIGQRVEGGKARVHVQLDAFLLRLVGAYVFLPLHDVAGIDDDIVVVFAEDDLALDEQVLADLDSVDDGLVVVRAQEFAHADRAGAVGDVKAQHRAAVFDRAARDGDDVSLDRDLAGVHAERAHLHRLGLDGLAEDHVALRRVAGAGRGAHRRRGRQLRARVLRHDRHLGEDIVVTDPFGELGDVSHRGHRGEVRADRKRALLLVDRDVGNVRLAETAAAVLEIRAAGEDRQKGRVPAHALPSSSMSASSASNSSS